MDGSTGPAQRPSENGAAMTMSDVLTLPDDLREATLWLLRQGAPGITQAEFAAHLGDTTGAESVLAALTERNALQTTQDNGTTRYALRVAARATPRPARRPAANLDLWKALDS